MKKLIAMGVFAAVLTSGAQAASLEGRWQLQDAANTQAKLDEAVENVVQEMNFFIRALARPVLEKQTQICQQWLLAKQASEFSWQCDQQEADNIPLTAQGEVFKTDEEGLEISGTFSETDQAIVVIVESERGIRTNTWLQTADNELKYTVKLESEKLPTPLTWSLIYRR
ncbi:hypothetical protein [Marinomonas posidonica]|uniref:Lipocalin-like domain-containing protein n=1 Tax=Marinomonas posidonica (strain CECT 7376 / NCIMB 14433 / IVIA-Po-181) TaxID=491952 RepID=F6CV35_MARPP|nr:hypothetical protein [Marinomonas posidonica]AEF56455.1 hypothetical protein Mar181_3439 [Marinomonas posidonica IVIA-Po-181]